MACSTANTVPLVWTIGRHRIDLVSTRAAASNVRVWRPASSLAFGPLTRPPINPTQPAMPLVNGRIIDTNSGSASARDWQGLTAAAAAAAADADDDDDDDDEMLE